MEENRKPVIYVPTLKDLMMVTEGALNSGTFYPDNSLVLYSHRYSTRLFTDLPRLESHGHADTVTNSDIMVAKTNMGSTRDYIFDMARNIDLKLGDLLVDEISEKEYKKVLSPWATTTGREIDKPGLGNDGLILRLSYSLEE